MWSRRDNSPVNLALAFVQACNNRDRAALEKILAPDFVFQDSLGGRFEGREPVLAAVALVAAMVPDLRVEIDEAVLHGDSALLTGRSICSDERFACDTQWRGVARDGLLTEWEAYGARAGMSIVRALRSLDGWEGG